MRETLNPSSILFSPNEDKALVYLNWFRPHFEAALEGYLEAKVKEAANINPETVVLVEEIKRFAASGGKRVRPAFLYSGYVAAGGLSHDAAIFASLSVELIHIFALIHDDIIDNSDLRRGKPTTHRIFEKFHEVSKLNGDPKQYSLSTAILVGDLALSFAEQILTEAPFPQERLRRARAFFDLMKIQVIYGEYLDVLGGYKKEISEDEVLQILDLKTARYTVERPLHIGAILAGAEPKVLEVVSAYAIPLGQAFQLQDDILGTFGDEVQLGKPNDSDIKEGKKTLLVAKALSAASEKEKKIIFRVLGNQRATSLEIKEFKEVLQNTGAYDYAVALAKKLIVQAREVVEEADLVPEGKDYLLAASDYLLNRKL